jgi:hypothetical protein
MPWYSEVNNGLPSNIRKFDLVIFGEITPLMQIGGFFYRLIFLSKNNKIIIPAV